MRILLAIAKKEYVSALRDKVLWLMAGITWGLLLLAAITGWQKQQGLEAEKRRAAALFRHEWEEQHDNPHSAAHFGTYLYKPQSVLGAYDDGVNTYLGTTYRVEAHEQHDLSHSEAGQSDNYLPFGELSVARVFQLLVPLLILLVCFNTISKEREGNTLQLLLVQGVRPHTLLWGKIGGGYAIVLTIIVPALLLLAVPVLASSQLPQASIRFLLFSATYLLYFFLFVCIGVGISAGQRSSGAALMTCLGSWLMLVVLLPGAVARLADAAHPLPSRYELNRSLDEGYSKGMGNDGDQSERNNAYLQQVLKKYGVDTVTKLPMNFDGLSMQYSEDYNAKVYDFYSQKVDAIMARQQYRIEQAALADPLLAVQQLSMAWAGTSYGNHQAFHTQATHYRNQLVRVLNDALAYSGSVYLTYDYEVGPEFFKKMADFRYQPPSWQVEIRQHRTALLALLFWAGLIFFCFIPIAARRLQS